MSKVRAFLLGLMATMSLCAMASASASGAVNEFLVEGEEVTTAVSAEGTSGVSKIEGEIFATKVTIECKKDTIAAKLEEEGKSTGEVKLKECNVVTPTGCKVKEPIEVKFIGALVKEPLEDELKPAAGETFTTVTIEGCALAGSYQVKGTQTCGLPKVAEELVEHEIECTAAGSNLKMGGNAAQFISTEKLKLASGLKWNAKQAPVGVLIRPRQWKYKAAGEKRVFKIINNTAGGEEVKAGTILPNETIFKVTVGKTCYEKKIYIAGAACSVTIEATAKGNATFEITPLIFPVVTAKLTL